jgi:hypothetical protein
MAAAGLIVRASCTPVSLDFEDLLAELRPEGLALGSSISQSKDLVITGGSGGIALTLFDAVMTAGPAKWGKTELRAGEVGWESRGMGQIFTIAPVA